jgi:hypothetical protein
MSNSNADIVYSLSNIQDGAMQLPLTRIKAKVSDWEECFQEINEACAFHWTIQVGNRATAEITVNSNASVESSSPASSKKTRVKRVLFSKLCNCHRSGSYI